MGEIDVINYLMADTKRELDKLAEYYNACLEAREKSTKDNCSYWTYFRWEEPRPSKARIKENMKVIRRTSLELEKQLEKIDIY